MLQIVLIVILVLILLGAVPLVGISHLGVPGSILVIILIIVLLGRFGVL